MSTTALIHLAIMLVVDLAWASGFWLPWPKYLYQKTKEWSWLWSWLANLNVPKTELNGVRAIKGFCLIQIIFVTLSSMVKIAFSLH